MNSTEWLQTIKLDPTKFRNWLVKQYHGEVSAAGRIRELARKYARTNRERNILNVIADQEETHAQWVYSLLKARNLDPTLAAATNRYWSKTLPAIDSFETAMAVGAHAEAMRLERIRAIVADPTMDEDVVFAFKIILTDEIFHERAFRELAGEHAMGATAANHETGRKLLGLTA